MSIKHTDGTQKVFCKDANGVTSRCIDMMSSELNDIISQHIQMHQDEIAIWEELRKMQKEWRVAQW